MAQAKAVNQNIPQGHNEVQRLQGTRQHFGARRERSQNCRLIRSRRDTEKATDQPKTIVRRPETNTCCRQHKCQESRSQANERQTTLLRQRQGKDLRIHTYTHTYIKGTKRPIQKKQLVRRETSEGEPCRSQHRIQVHGCKPVLKYHELAYQTIKGPIILHEKGHGL